MLPTSNLLFNDSSTHPLPMEKKRKRTDDISTLVTSSLPTITHPVNQQTSTPLTDTSQNTTLELGEGGIYLLFTGNKYMGVLQNGLPHGKGTITYKDGTIHYVRGFPK